MGFLSGDTQTIQARADERMQDAAADERFEEAARYRNRLFSIRHLADRQAADRRDVGTVDVIGLAVDGDEAAVQVFPLRDGKMIDRYGFHLENVAGQDAPVDPRGVRPRVLRRRAEHSARGARPAGHRGHGGARRFLTERRGSRVVVRAPLRGEKRRLVELAAENARLALEADAAVRASRALEADRRARGAPRGAQPREPAGPDRVLRRLEHPGRVDRRVDDVFVDGRPRNAHYRTFAIRGLDGQDDVGAMREAVSRRFARLRERRPDESFSRMPNLVVVDGGKAQLAAALAAMEELDLPRVAVIALAKREEEVFVPGFPAPIVLERSSPALQLLQRIRDEAHRVALRYHRRKRGARSMETIFEGAAGDRPRAPPGDHPALRLGRALPRGLTGGARGRARPASEDRARALRAAAQGRSLVGAWLGVAFGSSAPTRRRPEAAERLPKRTVRSVSAIAVNPATTFVSVRVSFAPTLKASRTDAEATPLST